MIRLNNNIEIPQMGVGTWTLKGETAINNVCMALKTGFRHIDTAQMYENEAEVGQGIINSGVTRKEISPLKLPHLRCVKAKMLSESQLMTVFHD